MSNYRPPIPVRPISVKSERIDSPNPLHPTPVYPRMASPLHFTAQPTPSRATSAHTRPSSVKVEEGLVKVKREISITNLTMPKLLPREVRKLMLDMAVEEASSQSRNQMLCSASLISKDWRELAQESLCQHVVIKSQAMANKWVQVSPPIFTFSQSSAFRQFRNSPVLLCSSTRFPLPHPPLLVHSFLNHVAFFHSSHDTSHRNNRYAARSSSRFPTIVLQSESTARYPIVSLKIDGRYNQVSHSVTENILIKTRGLERLRIDFVQGLSSKIFVFQNLVGTSRQALHALHALHALLLRTH